MIDNVLNNHTKIDVLCVGTPLVTGDALGPLVGSMLQQYSFNKSIQIIGTVEKPVTTSTYEKMIARLRDDSFILVVDATLGLDLWTYEIVMEPTNPGGALNTGIKPIGDASVKAYTGSTIEEMLQADYWDVAKLAHNITTELKDLLSYNKNNNIYRKIKINI
jgi:putative sporulation protein YyaC